MTGRVRRQQAWASEVLARLEGIAPDATVLDVGCGTGLVTEALLALVPQGRVLAIDASADMVALAHRRLGDRAEVWCQDVLDVEVDEPVDAIVSTAALHWVTDHDRLWTRLARALRPGGVLEVQCGGEGNIDRVREVIEVVARDAAPELVGDLYGAIVALLHWADVYMPAAAGEDLRLRHRACGRLTHAKVVCAACGEELDPREVEVELQGR